jgi:hypothetical protein
MLQLFKDWLYGVWDQRFKFGGSVSSGGLGMTRFANGEYMIVGNLLCVMSTGTGHWPWFLCELGIGTGSRFNWHLGLLGFTVGQTWVHVIDDETGEVVGPDKKKYYWFFKGINHKEQKLEEII